MGVVERLSFDGVPTDSGAGTPSPLPAERSADGLETIELGPVLDLVAGYAAGPLGAGRARAGRRSTSTGSVSSWPASAR
jgi:hypothetical protein